MRTTRTRGTKESTKYGTGQEEQKQRRTPDDNGNDRARNKGTKRELKSGTGGITLDTKRKKTEVKGTKRRNSENTNDNSDMGLEGQPQGKIARATGKGGRKAKRTSEEAGFVNGSAGDPNTVGGGGTGKGSKLKRTRAATRAA